MIVCLPFPYYEQSIPILGVHNAIFSRFGLSEMAIENTPPEFREAVRAIAEKEEVAVFDPRKSLCPSSKCITEINGVSLYRDNNHIVASQIGILDENLKEVLTAQPGAR
ncbi:MAG TPA: SGNH hydrolase domain-containing protein [Granulicella sp.]